MKNNIEIKPIVMERRHEDKIQYLGKTAESQNPMQLQEKNSRKTKLNVGERRHEDKT